MRVVTVHLGDRSYPIKIARGVINRLGAELTQLQSARDPVIVTTRPIARLIGHRVSRSLKAHGWDPMTILIPEGEQAKSASVVFRLLNQLAAQAKRKQPILIAVGGGVVGDLTGFIAAVYKRGIPYVQVPTTLTAQVDSAIGGKTAINLPVGKNLIGTFYQPRAVYSDLGLLTTLPEREFKSGLVEVIKYGAILDRSFFERLERDRQVVLQRSVQVLEFIVSRSSQLKARVVEQDELDQRGVRMRLNFGHTVGHAIEAACQYRRSYTHGEAVSIGMVAASRLAVRLHLMRVEEALRLERLLTWCGLPTVARGVPYSRVWQAMQHDKKFLGETSRWVLPLMLGKGIVKTNIHQPLVKGVLRELIHG